MSTLKDVAKECGLSVTTVSRALNNRGYISKEAHEKIQAAMKKLNYQPNVNNMLITFAVLAFFWVFFLFYYLKC